MGDMSKERGSVLERVRGRPTSNIRNLIPPAIACIVCGYSPGRHIPDRCPVCRSHRDHFQRV